MKGIAVAAVPQPGVPLDADQLELTAARFGMLAATSRLQIIWLLAGGERDVGTLATEVGQTVATVSQHLAKLKLAGLVKSRRSGRRQIYLVDDPRLVDMIRLTVGDRERPGTPVRAEGA